MYTSSYFIYKGPSAVSIAGGAPKWYTGRQYKNLAPKYWFFKEYKEEITFIKHSKEICTELAMEREFAAQQLYIERYNKEVLDRLDPQQVYNDLGRDAVLLCWEPPGQFCHRRLAATWLENELGIIVPEYVKD